MYAFRIKIGNVIAEVDAIYPYVKRICSDYISDEHPNCSIKITPDAIDRQREESSHTAGVQILPLGQNEDWFVEVYVLLHELLRNLPLHNMLFIHGSAILYQKKAYIFVAPSGTGKSTHTRLWKERFGDEVTIINDDKPFLSIQDGKFILHGTPWRGKHNIGVNTEAELAGICILSRGITDSISPIHSSEAVREIIKQCNLHRYKENAPLALDLIDELLKNVPVYSLSCTPTQNAVEVCCNAIVK